MIPITMRARSERAGSFSFSATRDFHGLKQTVRHPIAKPFEELILFHRGTPLADHYADNRIADGFVRRQRGKQMVCGLGQIRAAHAVVVAVRNHPRLFAAQPRRGIFFVHEAEILAHWIIEFEQTEGFHRLEACMLPRVWWYGLYGLRL